MPVAVMMRIRGSAETTVRFENRQCRLAHVFPESFGFRPSPLTSGKGRFPMPHIMRKAHRRMDREGYCKRKRSAFGF